MITPIDPCGVVMDWARHCYHAKMVVYQGQPPIDVLFYRARPGAKLFPGPHVFGSAATWRRGEPTASIGEVESGAYYRGPNNWGLMGIAPCGPLAAFQRGGIVGVDPPLVLNPDGTAKCCKKAWVARGGVKVNGKARFKVRVVQKGKGGVKADGRAPQGNKNFQQGRGGVRCDGQALQFVRVQQLAGGGLLAGGAADQLVNVQQLAGGGLLAGGAADQGERWYQVGEGGVEVGGVAYQDWFYSGVIGDVDALAGATMTLVAVGSVTDGPDSVGLGELAATLEASGTGSVTDGPDGSGDAQVAAQIVGEGTGIPSAPGVTAWGSLRLITTVTSQAAGHP